MEDLVKKARRFRRPVLQLYIVNRALNLEVIWEFDFAGVAPEAGEVVEFAGFVVKDVDDEIAIIEQDPFGGIIAFDPNGPPFKLIL